MQKNLKSDLAALGSALAVMLTFSILLGLGVLALSAMPFDGELFQLLMSSRDILLLNIWPVFWVTVFLYFLTNRVYGAVIGSSVLFLIIAQVNRFKIQFRDDPFIFSDILLFNEAKGMTEQYRLFWDAPVMWVLLGAVLTAAVCVLVRSRLKSKGIRLVGAVLSVLVFASTLSEFYFGYSRYSGIAHNEAFGTEFKKVNLYTSRGVVASFLNSIPEAFPSTPEGYDEQAAAAVLEAYETADIPEEKKVNVISIMLEAYNDFAAFDSVTLERSPYQNFNMIRENGYSGWLYTDVFSAGTLVPERQFLTGYLEYPSRVRNTESFVWYFKEQGYVTEAMHPHWGWFYNRRNINPGLGFDEFYYRENTFDLIPIEELKTAKYNGVVADYDVFRYLLDRLKQTVAAGDKYFNFTVTYQNHGPYPTTSLEWSDYIKMQPEYSQEDYNNFKNYLYGLERTDLGLGLLYEEINKMDEPVVLIFFGDHNPALGTNSSVYEMLGIDLDLSTPEGAQNYYQTPYVFYANPAAKEALGTDLTGQGRTISPIYLMGEFFEAAGLQGPAYMQYLNDVKQHYPVVNPVYVQKDGQYISRRDLQNDLGLVELKSVSHYVKNQ